MLLQITISARKFLQKTLDMKRKHETTDAYSLKKPKIISDPKQQDLYTNIANTQLNESDQVESRYSNLVPASTIGHSQDELLDLCFLPNVDPEQSMKLQFMKQKTVRLLFSMMLLLMLVRPILFAMCATNCSITNIFWQITALFILERNHFQTRFATRQMLKKIG
ncbi:hypothetical protein AVEN_51438-1 [Araneus ventricosus]|uniref:Uncharacterized protein n=1 Tax=Araneus ventricosus TaxID=182803 RepID=A0A4Y2GBT1_ARAVE|nr:hypothetical protein AVEN_51438-1 [Araneus ventricosus]